MRCRGRTPGFDPRSPGGPVGTSSSAEGLFTTIDIESSAQLQSHDRRQDDNKHTVEQDGLTIRAQAEQHLGCPLAPLIRTSALSDDWLDGKAGAVYELRYPVVI